MELETYLRRQMDRGIYDHSLRAFSDSEGGISFYVHPDGKDGDTADFFVDENNLKEIYSISVGDPDWIPHDHVVGDEHCTVGWCSCHEYPRICKCSGLIHAEFKEEHYDGGYSLWEKCDRCGDDFEEEL